eukprot:13007912-Ditylum_brightwellii.AAC.1
MLNWHCAALHFSQWKRMSTAFERLGIIVPVNNAANSTSDAEATACQMIVDNVGRIQVHRQYHITCNKADRCIKAGCHIVKQLVARCFCLFGGRCLLGYNHA